MEKYILVAKNMIIEIFMYRLNFSLWRIRVVLSLLTIYFLWNSLFSPGQTLFGYSSSQMLTYILITYFINSFVLSSRSYGIGEDIIQGNLSNFLIRPFNYFGYWFAKDIGDKLMNILFTLCEFTLILVLLKPPFFLQPNIYLIFLTILSVVIGIIIYFLCNITLACIGFWSQEVWAPRFIFSILISFFAGVLFPLDIMPRPIFLIFQALPFSYLIYFPAKIYLGKLDGVHILTGVSISIIWVIVLLFFTQKIWKKGLRSYGAYGK